MIDDAIRSAIVLAALAGGLLAPSVANALPPAASGPQASCGLIVPNGSTYDPTSGSVTLDGQDVATENTCTNGSGGSILANADDVGSFTGWADYVYADATEVDGVTAFNALYVTWNVPSNPQDSADSGNQFIWTGLRSDRGDETGWLIQPEVKWSSASGSWNIQCQAVPGTYAPPGSVVITSPAVAAEPGDGVEGTVYQLVSGNAGYGDKWLIGIKDTNSGESSFFYLETGLDQPSMNFVALGVYELKELSSCAGLSSSGFVPFIMTGLTEGGPDWATENNAEGLVTWKTAKTSDSPSCSYEAAVPSSPFWAAELGWQP